MLFKNKNNLFRVTNYLYGILQSKESKQILVCTKKQAIQNKKLRIIFIPNNH